MKELMEYVDSGLKTQKNMIVGTIKEFNISYKINNEKMDYEIDELLNLFEYMSAKKYNFDNKKEKEINECYEYIIYVFLYCKQKRITLILEDLINEFNSFTATKTTKDEESETSFLTIKKNKDKDLDLDR